MRVAVVAIVAGLLIIGCGEGAQPSPSTAGAAGGAVPTLEKSPHSGQVDRVGPADGALRPDGVKDLVFVCQIEGPVAGVFLVSVDEKGTPTGQFHADTFVGQSELPRELGARVGKATSGLGVMEGDKFLNAPDGSLPPLGAGLHRLLLHVAPTPTLGAGTRLRVYVARPDKTLLAGAVLVN